jgi:ubiquinol-cytochrome c reductase iron-sulfur subunit
MAIASFQPPLASGLPPVDTPSRRDFLFISTAAAAAVGVGSVAWPLIDQFNPDAASIAAGAPVDVDIGALAPGQQMVVQWRGHPIFITNRTPDSLKVLQDQSLLSQLSDPQSQFPQQPPYANNWSRSVKPEIGVLVGVCTHLGCIPQFEPDKGQQGPGWEGGYFCPCHGSKYDLAGRVFRGVPAPYNLPVPPYIFVSDKVVRVGENPPGQIFDLNAIVQI